MGLMNRGVGLINKRAMAKLLAKCMVRNASPRVLALVGASVTGATAAAVVTTLKVRGHI